MDVKTFSNPNFILHVHEDHFTFDLRIGTFPQDKIIKRIYLNHTGVSFEASLGYSQLELLIMTNSIIINRLATLDEFKDLDDLEELILQKKELLKNVL